MTFSEKSETLKPKIFICYIQTSGEHFTLLVAELILI
jgi:hypothetical protein